MRSRDITRLLAAAALPPLWNNLLLPRLHFGPRGRTTANALFATAYAAAFGSRTRPRRSLGADRRDTAAALLPAILVVFGYVVALAVPASRARLARIPDRSPEVSLAEWAGVQIPCGTVCPEELIFRATLDPLSAATLGRHGKWPGAAIFGLWHIQPARAAGDSVTATVAATTAAGLVLSALCRRAGIAAPVLLHLAVNAGGAIAPRAARRLMR